MDLYLDKLEELEKEFSKEAGIAARMTESPENWPQQVTSELLKQLPYLSDYEISVDLPRVDAQRGFAFGYADVSNRTERPEVEHAEMGIPHLRIPIIIVDRAMKPLNVVLDGERAMPLNEDRLREALFNAQTFDLSVSAPVDPSLTENFTPPHRTGMGYGGEVKTASTRSLLKAIASTIRETDAEAFVEKVASDPTLRAGFSRSNIAPVLVEVFDKTKRASAGDHLEVLADSVLPTVMTFHRLPGGSFLVKSASVDAFAFDKMAKGKVVSEEQAGQVMGQENAQSMQPGQTATAVAEPVPAVDPFEPQRNYQVIAEFGQYDVQDTMGNTLLGHVFPQTLAWDGDFSPQPVALFTNGSAYAVQNSISGAFVGKGTTLPKDEPRGDGVFYCVMGGEAVCTAPVTIQSVAAGPTGLPTLVGMDMFGNPVQVSFADELKTPTRVSDVEYALPSTWKFMRLNNQTQLIEDPSGMAKQAAYNNAKNSITLFWNGAFQVDGGCGLSKIASDMYSDMDAVQTEFLLGLLGVEGSTAKKKIAEARRKGSVKLGGLKEITTLGERYSESVKTAQAIASQIPNLRRDLVKEAASIEDENTADHILALNFINPENVSSFLAFLPELEETSEKLAEMLLSSYLGMKQLPEGALERSMRALEEVCQALRSMSQTEVK